MSFAPAAGRRRLVVLLAVLVVTTIAAIVVHRREGVSPRALRGETQQDRPIELELDDRGHAQGLATSVEAVCLGGHRWSIRWTPRDGQVRFRERGSHLVIREVSERPDQRGGVARIGALMVGQVRGHRAAGELRLVARFYRAGREVQACDSGPVRWAAGLDASSRLAAAASRRRPTGSYYPQVPSLAGTVSPARRRFIRATDDTCVRTYARARQAYDAVATARSRSRELSAYAAYVAAHAAQLRALKRLGVPPDGADLHARWIANMRTRIRLERRQLRLGAAGEVERVRAVARQIDRLKLLGNEVGQRFGLRLCTSNGPDRTPVPR